MLLRRLLIPVLFALALAGCGDSNAVSIDEYNTRPVKLPNGKTIRAEVMMRDEDMRKGMMFRDRMDPGHGMLFIHRSPGNYSYWMFQVKIPLDIVWMDRNRRVVEISANTPACASKSARECPSYGGKQVSLYVLELAGGDAARYGLQIGDFIDF